MTASADPGRENDILGQKAVRVTDEESQQLKGLVTDTDELIPTPQALIAEIDLEIGVCHVIHERRTFHALSLATNGDARIHQNSTKFRQRSLPRLR